MNFLHVVSIIFEVLVFILGLMIAVSKKKFYGACIAITFGLYVIYDLASFYAWNISSDWMYLIFFIASLSILWAVWRIYRD